METASWRVRATGNVDCGVVEWDEMRFNPTRRCRNISKQTLSGTPGTVITSYTSRLAFHENQAALFRAERRLRDGATVTPLVTERDDPADTGGGRDVTGR